MTTNAALVDGDTVVQLIVAPETGVDYEPPYGWTLARIPASFDGDVVPGSRYVDGSFLPPLEERLHAAPVIIPADGTTAAVVTYINTYDDAPDRVEFTVNGATKSVAVSSAGKAILDVVSSTPGDRILVSVDALPGQTVEILVED